MKQKLFENVGGNQFKLITESVDAPNPQAKLVREGLKKVFGAGAEILSYKRLQGVGLGYIKHVEEAKKTALDEARTLAKEYGYTDNENAQAFVKENDFSKLDAQNPSHSLAKFGSDEAEDYSPSESREVQIGREIIRYAKEISERSDIEELKAKIIELARELVIMHKQGEKI